MKLSKFLMLFFLTITIASCTSDDTDTPETNVQEGGLVGTWNLTEESQDGTISGVFGGIPVTGDITSIGFLTFLSVLIKSSSALNPTGNNNTDFKFFAFSSNSSSYF